MFRPIIVLAALSISSGAFAQSASTNDTPAAALSAWRIHNSTSQLDGAQSYDAATQSLGTVTNILGQQEKVEIGLSCDRKGFFLTIAWPDFVDITKGGFRDYATVVWKANDGPVYKSDFNAVTRGVVLMGNAGLSWAKGLGSATKLIVRVPDAHGGQEAAFDVTGIEKVVSDISARNCG